MVNGKWLNIPSHILKVGDVITLKENKQKKKIFVGLEERLLKSERPSWLKIEAKTLVGKILSLPSENDFERVFDVKLIIEYYSAR